MFVHPFRSGTFCLPHGPCSLFGRMEPVLSAILGDRFPNRLGCTGLAVAVLKSDLWDKVWWCSPHSQRQQLSSQGWYTNAPKQIALAQGMRVVGSAILCPLIHNRWDLPAANPRLVNHRKRACQVPGCVSVPCSGPTNMSLPTGQYPT